MNIRIWTNPQVKGIEFANNSYFNHSFKPHFHDHYVILTLNEGINIGECQRQPYAVTSSDILIINPSEIHTGSSWQAKFLDYVALYVSADFFHRQLNDSCTTLNNTLWFKQMLIKSAVQADLLRKIINESRDHFSSVLEDHITLFFQKIIHDFSVADLTTENKIYCRLAVKKGVEFIKQNYACAISITDYCRQENISCYSFIRSFQKFTGLTPGQFLINYRIEKAKKLLQQQTSINDACWDTGFFDQSHFNRHFKFIMGITPGQYRSCFT